MLYDRLRQRSSAPTSSRCGAKRSQLESVITERILSGADSSLSLPSVLRSLREAAMRLNLDPVFVEKILPHLAFQHTCPVMFIMGQPGPESRLSGNGS